MADGTSVVSDRWGTSAGPRTLREMSQYASRLRLPAAAENRRNYSQVSPCAGRLPSGRGANADRPFDEPTTSTARRVAAATWMMSSTTVASRAYAVVPARRSRWSRGGASRPSSAPAAGSARHRADASRRDRAARSPDPQPASCRRSFRRGFRARAAPSTRHRWCPRRTSSLFRAALVAMSLQELAYQILAPPVQFPFEFALAHLPGFTGREEGFGIREDSIGRRAREIDAADAGSRLLHVGCTSLESCRHSHRRSPFHATGTGACRVGRRPEKRADGALAGSCHPSNALERKCPRA